MERTQNENKLLVWIAMSPRGISEPFVMTSENSVGQFVCQDNCLASRLLPFIKKIILITSFDRSNSCHYAEHPLDFWCENLIHHVDEEDNPANLPEVRPIEDFWSILKAKVYENNWEAKPYISLKLESRNV